MQHLGDLTKLNGAEVPPVDIITFGSPCQNLSVSGNRQGLKGAKSSLFFEAIRLVKEMRTATGGASPRFLIWENVFGALSSNKGEDFRVVIEEIAKIKNAGVSVPKAKKWTRAGSLLGAGFTICWRVLNAEHFGIPQRRERVFLVAAFGGDCAQSLLFDTKAKSTDFEPFFRKWQDFTRPVSTGANEQRKAYIVKATAKTSKWHRAKAWETKRAPCLDCKGGTLNRQGWVAIVEGATVRRLTPKECASLQGFPKNWCDGLANAEPNEETLAFWRVVFADYCRVFGIRQKTDKQILKWLASPHTDSAEYKMWGNGVALPCVLYVLHALTYNAQSPE